MYQARDKNNARPPSAPEEIADGHVTHPDHGNPFPETQKFSGSFCQQADKNARQQMPNLHLTT
ncbi:MULTISPECIES: hypothetical protein [unclassified Thalassospira]|uniref:hypothetical protein n=1 Tax=unclassified Thalassospira TaxID=2648997 RepID=UPI000ECE54D1|nr:MULTISPECIES: hypothetical protein [unclassified Thalassospira]HAI28508.1 hypothetical protein [Thalassospira sp.]|tara:strand:+ start:3704 stop:3892 length:189 start_codon:yes stop_codon:yes gene_type:complete